MIYLSSPYSNPSPIIRHQRFVDACTYKARLMLEGKMIYSAIAESHSTQSYAKFCGTISHEMWMKYDIDLLGRMDEMHVLMLDGWEDSKGVQEEIIFAEEHNIPITYVTFDRRSHE